MAICPSCQRRYSDDVMVCEDDGEALLPDEALDALDVDLEAGPVPDPQPPSGQVTILPLR